MGYAVPFSAHILYDKYNVGHGIISMQGKEAKHSGLKNDLKMSTNRSCSQDEEGKWHHVAQGSFVRNFYLPYHFPLETYVSQSDSRNPPVKGNAVPAFDVYQMVKIYVKNVLPPLIWMIVRGMGFYRNT